MSYEEALRYLLSLGRELASPRQAHVQKFDLQNISKLAERMGHPERRSPCVHIAGTNGKGSTAAMMESILRAAGMRTGLYTSPHLERINERIRINGEPVSDAQFTESFERVLAAIEALMASGALPAHPTFFECMTAIAFDVFARSEIEFAVYEVGMGGRLDATNIVTAEVSIITQIAFDHEAYLGHSLEEIAGEKAGIIKPDGIVVSAAERPEARAVIAQRCQEQHARLVEVDQAWSVIEIVPDASGDHARARWLTDGSVIKLKIPLAGKFQVRNALTAAAAAKILFERGFALNAAVIESGIPKVQWPGRLEHVAEHPDFYLDGAHNPAAARELRAFWDERMPRRRIILVYGAMRDKAVDEIAGLLFPRAEHVILTQPNQARAISAHLLARMTCHHAANCEAIASPSLAIERALQLAGENCAVFITGSLFLVGEARSRFCEKTPNLHIFSH
ncbi:MAG: folylpolyglutamate synthase/dihydrofolate synthase family protein [Candidatus Acidiferrales bacterium]